MVKLKRKTRIYLLTAITSAITIFGAFWGTREWNNAEAAAKAKETIEFRIVGTTDLHGQLNSTDYELGIDYNNGGLARVFDLIQTIRSELPKENIITLDAGDTLYDYTTEYIFSENQNVIQPIYKAMSVIGYDAITLGNHDFDYGYDYILRQLDGTGLRDKTVVSNVQDSKTGEFPFLENMLITRKVKTSAGNEMEVKVGIIGQTIPTLTSKTHSYAGILKTEDMVQNAKTQAAKLKEMGADIIVALSHTGIGPAEPELNFKNVAYALTKIPEIDVVVCGHEHNLYPTSDMTSPYYKLPNVDKETFLMNGKNVVMAGDRGEAVGVVDLTLEVFDGTLEIADRHSELRMVNEKSTKQNQELAKLFGTWEDQLLKYSTNVITKLAEGTVIQNYFGLLGDNVAIQLLNDAKIDYGLRYVKTAGKKYEGYPIVAASTYSSFGAASINDFISIKDEVTESKLTSIQPYNNYLYIYTINGKQLREWLEWSASAYETSSLSTSWKGGTMAELMNKTGLKSLISEEWLDDWSSFYIFDGINYVIDTTRVPRYDISGNKISNSTRISSITYNGEPVNDSTKLLIVTNKITIPTAANSGVEKQSVLGGFVRTQTVLSKYMDQISSEDHFTMPILDNNWKVNLPAENQFMIKVPYYADSIFKKTPWFVKDLDERNQYKYYVASYPKSSGDNEGPHIVATPIINTQTASAYEVAVNVSDASNLKTIRYVSGDHDLDYNAWVAARNITETKAFTVYENGIYSIYAEDVHGNKSTYRLVIDNFNENMLGRPTYITYTNRKASIKGRGEPGATIVFEAYTGTYEGKVNSKGDYSYALPSQPSGTELTIYVKDSNGLESERVTLKIKRTGPNQPSVSRFSNKDRSLVGETRDDDATVIAIVDDVVYVSDEGGKELFEKNTEIYNPGYEIVETKVTISKNGTFSMELPPQAAGKTISVYNLDHLSRNSRVNTLTVREDGPNAPYVYEVSNIERSLSGYIPNAGNKTYNITIVIGEETYHTTTDKNGNFTYKFGDQLHAGDMIDVTVSDEKNGSTRKNTTKILVKNIDEFVKTDSTTLTLNKVTNKSYLVIGNYEDTGTVYIAISKGEGKNFRNTLDVIETDETGRFVYDLDDKLEEGSTVYAMTRFTDGKILAANKTTVLGGAPSMPSLVKEITNTDKKVQVIAQKDCEIALTIGSKTYTTSESVYDEENDKYIYTLEIDRDVTGTEVSVTSTNLAGTSEAYTTTIVKAAPDQPEVNTVKSNHTKITGKIEVMDEETEVFAQIGKKTYKGTVDKKGNFSIKIPKQKAKTAIKVWGTNKEGRGPLVKIEVKK